MQEYIRKRVLDICNYILEESATVRQTANVFGVSKSTVHKDMTERLPIINKELADKIKEILEKNKAERHLRGGEATKKKYMCNKDTVNEIDTDIHNVIGNKIGSEIHTEMHPINELKTVNE
ncbi:sporulation transcriptional regulator SpoIIID [Desulfonispora thiosulfatigenes DSM 11270]|uniref:Sporulation transcriptional regulator SpoIIID n=1 Tax=Desulfonispora thiosulfatigenes DSM 11270 TaxID=656914 RepID=A0A1W1V4M0_DESTI|nr:sporulation transcriptional regulator SpoIIID [Desulfonispora thiosulfatigenes DSM 11270]